MSETNDSAQLFEMYKLHAELADRVSQRRAVTNRLYGGLLTGLMAAALAFLRIGPAGETAALVLFILGFFLSVSWYIVIRSYRQLNTGKFLALTELEAQLPYRFFEREWELLGEGRDFRRYWKLTVVENFLSILFLVSFIILIAFTLYLP